ncbi:carbohydrate ABC transporter permease, partial [Streptomyces albogriseolus]
MSVIAADPKTAGEREPARDRRLARVAASSDRRFAAISHALLILWSVIVIVPMLWVLMSSFKSTGEILSSPFSLPDHWRIENYANAWTDANIGRYFLNSVIVVVSALILVMLLGAMCAYILARFEFPGRRLIYYVMLAGLTFPVFLA